MPTIVKLTTCLLEASLFLYFFHLKEPL